MWVFKCTPCHKTRRFRDVHALRMREVRLAYCTPCLLARPPAQQQFKRGTSAHCLASGRGCPDAPLTISGAHDLDLTAKYRHRTHRFGSASLYGSKLCRFDVGATPASCGGIGRRGCCAARLEDALNPSSNPRTQLLCRSERQHLQRSLMVQCMHAGGGVVSWGFACDTAVMQPRATGLCLRLGAAAHLQYIFNGTSNGARRPRIVPSPPPHLSLPSTLY